LNHDRRKRVLVTGGAGFVGSHLIDRLVSHGDHVVCVDNLYTGSRRNLEHLRGHPHLEFIQHDITRPLQIDVDEIYNLACPASPTRYQRDPIFTIRTSIEGALNMLELARKIACPVLQASTSEVYGDPEIHPQPEDYWGRVNPIGPRSCYDEGKRCAETLFFDYHRVHGVAIKVARIFNTYGPRMDAEDGRVVANFVVQALAGKPLTVYGDGMQTRSFCYVDDLVDGLVRLMATPIDFTGPVNLGNPDELTISELADKVLKTTRSKSVIRHQALPQDDPRQRRPDITRARRDLGWSPRVSLDEGLVPTIAYFAQARSLERSTARDVAAVSKT
jgi:UDP-glucuronate decarboxylase